MLFNEGFTFRNFLVDAFTIFMFFILIWLLITVFADLFSRRDISGFAKVIWTIVLIVFPYLGVFAYILTQSNGMYERRVEHAQQVRDDLRRTVGFSVADELEKLNRLRADGTVSDQEYGRLRARLVM
ncbi:PLDc N-terminal domain-containing protein [Hyphomicrobium sp. 2TAF46]|uniref:SHOCT domain-containing protein n=1 Tax=Hyphomicrobium sp. 2TAF46 TaxID=3233019 RepID=UPI003F8E666E